MKKSLIVLSVLGVLSANAMAAVDVSPITDIVTDIGLVGAAVFGVLVAVKGIKLLRRAL